VIVLEMAIVLRGGFDVAAPAAPMANAGMANTRQLGIELFTNYLYPLQVAAVLLLVAIISAIALTLRERKDSKALDPSIQLRARKSERLRVVRMEPERPAAPVAADGAVPAAAATSAAPGAGAAAPAKGGA
jgi:NADH-quinone oxidoreductase subunit J